MISESFASGRSFIHRLDPRIRILAATVYSCVVAVAKEFPVLAAAVAVSCTLIVIGRLPLKGVAKRLIPVNGLILFIWLVVPLTYGGVQFFQIADLGVSREGVLLAARITLKSNAIIIAFMALIDTMPLATLGHALKLLWVPRKIIHLLLMNYRYVYVLDQEYQRLIRAAKIRGFQPGTNLHTYRTYAYVIGMLLVRAVSRAQRVHQAMLCRGFKGTFYSLHEFRAHREDWMFLISMTVLVMAMTALELGWTGW